MAKKKLTEEQENEIKTLLANNEMLEKSRKEAEERGQKTSVKQIERAQQEVIEHINSIDPTALEGNVKGTSLSSKKKVNQVSLFNDTDMSIFDILKENEALKASENETRDVAVAEGTENNIVE